MTFYFYPGSSCDIAAHVSTNKDIVISSYLWNYTYLIFLTYGIAFLAFPIFKVSGVFTLYFGKEYKRKKKLKDESLLRL